MSRISLLDVNLLVALFNPDHIHHDLAHDWFADHRSNGWATCAVTENGLIRVLAQTAPDTATGRPAELIERLRAFRESGDHHAWLDSVSLCDQRLFNATMIRGHRQITDVYLLGLAVKMGGRLATFDRGIPLSAVRGATRQSLQVIEPAGT